MFSAFIDLVGTRERARHSSNDYREALSTFQQRVAESLLVTGSAPSVRVYIFSDSAFVESEARDSLIAFLVALRSYLLLDGLYFTGAIRRGGLEARPAAAALGGLVSAATRQKLEKSLLGNCFSSSAADLYVDQELIKGIGFSAEKSFAPSQKAAATSAFVWSCFLPEFGSRQARAFLDLRIPKKDLTPDGAERILRDAFSAKTRSRKYGRFYVSLLVTWVQSASLQKTSNRHDDRIVEASASGELERLLGDVVGIELVYLAILGRVLGELESVGTALRREFNRKLMRHRKVARALEFAPEEILPPALRERFVEGLARVMKTHDYDETEARDLAADLRRQGEADEEVQRRLAAEGFRARNGRPWTIDDLKRWRKG